MPEPIRSPSCRLQPLLAWWASICATVQYRFANEVRARRSGAARARRIAALAIYASSVTARPPCARSSASSRCGSGARIALRPRERGGAERRQRLGRHHPGRDRGGKALGEERPERLRLPALDVARRPVVEQTKAEDVPGRLADRYGGAELGRHADIEAELKLEIEIARRPVARLRLVGALALAARPPDRRTARAHRGRAAVIGDRHIFVVGQHRIVRPERAPGIGGVKQRGEEIGEIGNGDRHLDFGLRHRRQICPQTSVTVRGAEPARKREPQRGPRARPKRHQTIESRRGARSCRLGGKAVERGGRRRQIEDLIADRNADARARVRRRPKDAERQILHREFAVGRVCALHPAAPRRVVRFVERRHTPPCRCSSRRRRLSLSRRLPSASIARASSG